MQPNRLLPDTLRLYRGNGISLSHWGTGHPMMQDVLRFMVACGHAQSLHASDNLADPVMMARYMRFVKEEYHETIEAFEDFLKDPSEYNLAQVIDGLFDLQWVAMSVQLTTGTPSRLVWAEGAWSNLCKIDEKTGEVDKDANGKVKKPSDWQPPCFEAIVKEAKPLFTLHEMVQAAELWHKE